jgi:hypothetical protein
LLDFKKALSRNREYLDWELNRFVELQHIQQQAAQAGFIGTAVDTTRLTAQEIADFIWNDINGR